MFIEESLDSDLKFCVCMILSEVQDEYSVHPIYSILQGIQL